jgi:VIT1/CCC1 family predicted Fe2+/Mn2+ transporter
MIFAALGCNTAWGIVDGVMYVLTNVFERSRYTRVISSIRSTVDKNAALAVVEEELEPIKWVLDEKERKRIYAEVLKSASKASPQEALVRNDDVFGAFSCFLLVFFSTFPVIIPFLIMRNLEIATRASNLVAIVMLFAIGYEWAKYTNKNRLRAGIGMVLIGSIIVGITVALGG